MEVWPALWPGSDGRFQCPCESGQGGLVPTWWDDRGHLRRSPHSGRLRPLAELVNEVEKSMFEATGQPSSWILYNQSGQKAQKIRKAEGTESAAHCKGQISSCYCLWVQCSSFHPGFTSLLIHHILAFFFFLTLLPFFLLHTEIYFI